MSFHINPLSISTTNISPQIEKRKGEDHRNTLFQNHLDIASLFPKSVAELESGYHLVKSDVLACLSQITNLAAVDRTFENTVLAYDTALAYFQSYGNLIQTIKMVHPDEVMLKKLKRF